MHERVSVSALCYPRLQLPGILDELAKLDSHSTSIPAWKIRDHGWDAGTELVRRSGLQVLAVSETLPLPDHAQWSDPGSKIVEALEAAAAIGAPLVYVVAGPRLPGPWANSAAAFAEGLSSVAGRARELGVRIAIEPLLPLYANVGFLTSLHDFPVLAQSCDVDLCLDVYQVWTEAELDQTIERVREATGLVQISDQVLGDWSLPCRAVPGDGAAPLTEFLRWVDDAGYQGVFDIEISGPRIDAEGHAEAARRASDTLGKLLSDTLG